MPSPTSLLFDLEYLHRFGNVNFKASPTINKDFLLPFLSPLVAPIPSHLVVAMQLYLGGSLGSTSNQKYQYYDKRIRFSFALCVFHDPSYWQMGREINLVTFPIFSQHRITDLVLTNTARLVNWLGAAFFRKYFGLNSAISLYDDNVIGGERDVWIIFFCIITNYGPKRAVNFWP